MNTIPTFSEFEADALAQGFDEVLERTWQPGLVLDTHAHPFAVKALVVQGAMWLTVLRDAKVDVSILSRLRRERVEASA